jgi:hypothetical protein
LKPPRSAQAAAAASPKTPDIAYVEVQLPSRGLLYGPAGVVKTPPIPEGRVHVRKMLIAEDEILAGAGGSALTRVSKIIARCTKLPDGFDPEHLLLFDRMFLLLTIRTHTFGPIYQIEFRCPQCRHKNSKRPVNIVEDLNEIPVNADLREPIEVHLPDLKQRIGIRLLRGADEHAVVKAAKEAENRGQTGTPVQDQLRQIIVAIDGELVSNPLARIDLIRQFSAADLVAVREALDQNDFGIDTTVQPTCERCEAAVELDMPFGTDFLRPASR